MTLALGPSTLIAVLPPQMLACRVIYCYHRVEGDWMDERTS